jgi:hypothetical protein
MSAHSDDKMSHLLTGLRGLLRQQRYGLKLWGQTGHSPINLLGELPVCPRIDPELTHCH